MLANQFAERPTCYDTALLVAVAANLRIVSWAVRSDVEMQRASGFGAVGRASD